MICHLNFRFHLGASWFHSDELEMDGTATMIPRREPIKTVKVFQVSRSKLQCLSVILIDVLLHF